VAGAGAGADNACSNSMILHRAMILREAICRRFRALLIQRVPVKNVILLHGLFVGVVLVRFRLHMWWYAVVIAICSLKNNDLVSGC